MLRSKKNCDLFRISQNYQEKCFMQHVSTFLNCTETNIVNK